VHRISVILAEIIVDTEYRYTVSMAAISSAPAAQFKDCFGIGQFSTGR
jgi:hypothetical protein